MADFDKTNKGCLFENDKTGNPKKPDYTGSINVDGKDYRISAWIKPPSGNTNSNYLSLSISPKDQSAVNAYNNASNQTSVAEREQGITSVPEDSSLGKIDDELPF